MQIQRRTPTGFTLIELLVVVGILGLLAALIFPAIGRSRNLSKLTICRGNLRALGLGMMMYAGDNTQGRFTPHRYLGLTGYEPVWIWRYLNCPVKTFICPNTKHKLTLIQNDPVTGNKYYPGLLHSGGFGGSEDHSYDYLPFFSDLPDHWNGAPLPNALDSLAPDQMPYVPKTLNNIVTYRHRTDALGLVDRIPGPSAIWLSADTDSMLWSKNFIPDPENNHSTNGLNVVFGDGHVEWVSRRNVVSSHELSQDNNRSKEYPQR